MKTVELEDEVYAHIASQTQEIGESASDILRRLLRVTPQHPRQQAQAGQHELAKALSEVSITARNATEGYLAVLSHAYKQRPRDFERVLSFQGRGRLYFARSEHEISASGDSTHPKRIPETPYWAMTNASTQKKAEMLRDALRIIGFSDEAARAAATTINAGRI